jgi:hypothetical protein
MRYIALFLLCTIACLKALPQNKTVSAVSELSDFESTWVLSSLNNNRDWLEGFFAGELSVRPGNEGARSRYKSIANLIDPDLRSDQFKVRISGRIEMLTSDPNRNRFFDFLDTFNRIDGKWRVIAQHFAPENSTPGSSADAITRTLLDLENRWAQVDVTNDRSIFEKIIAPEFVGTDSKGVVRDRSKWLADWTYENVKSAQNIEMQVNVVSENLAVVTGIDVTTKQDNAREVTHRDRFTDTWLERSGQWQCISEHVTRLQ